MNCRSPARVAADKPADFDFTLHIRQLCHDMILRLEELRHIDMAAAAVSFAQARNAECGRCASLMPLRCAGGTSPSVAAIAGRCNGCTRAAARCSRF